MLSFNASGSDPFRITAGAAEAGMSYSCVTKPGFWSSFHNQAILAHNTSFSCGFSFDSRFGIKELGTRVAALSLPAGKASIGALYSHFGFPDFRREMAGLACGLKLSESLSAGVMIDYLSRKTSGEYGNSVSLTFEGGFIFKASGNVVTGIHLFNPVPNSIRKSCLPSRIRCGAGISLSNSLYAAAEAEMGTGSSIIIRTGLEYNASEKVWIRSGFSTDNNSFSIGIGYIVKSVKIDTGFAAHEKLGITSTASVSFLIR